jgi:serine/threonine protein kinase
MDPIPPQEDDAPGRKARASAAATRHPLCSATTIVGELGRGGMGVVLLARDRRLQREVAIKLLPAEVDRDPKAREQFLAEARTLAALNHPNIAIIHSLEEEAGRHFLTMERIEGRSLRERLRDGPLALEEALAIARQVARALEAAHEQGVVHRDLKPSNVMLKHDGKVKVLDFGLALRLDQPGADVAADGEVAGTPGYMSPEQVRGEPADARSDVWALVCCSARVPCGPAARCR